VLALELAQNPVELTVADIGAAVERGGDSLQDRFAIGWLERPRGLQQSRQLGIGARRSRARRT
jgi:hypothetical protein